MTYFLNFQWIILGFSKLSIKKLGKSYLNKSSLEDVWLVVKCTLSKLNKCNFVYAFIEKCITDLNIVKNFIDNLKQKKYELKL